MSIAHSASPNQTVDQMARQFGMSERDIFLGVNSANVEYDMAEVHNDDGTNGFDVTLKSFNIARARLFNSYFAAINALDSAISLKPPAIISWDAKADGDPKLYRVGGLDITLSSRPGGSDGIPIPVIHIGPSKLPAIDQLGQPGFENPSAKVLVGRLDPKNANDEVLFLTYNGGAHCCTDIKVFAPSGGAWKIIELGTWDGEPLSTFPMDIDGDHIPDIVFYDQRFLYTFASYAGSYAPPQIFNLVDGAMSDVSSNSRYTNFFRQEMTRDQAGCLLHENGACAAFVATASRAGLHDYAWQFMLENYDQKDTWGLPKICDVAASDGKCPAGHESTPSDFPTALTGFLADTGYYQSGITRTAEFVSPSFNCGKVRSQVLQLVCTTPDLAMADQELAAAYVAVISSSSPPTTLKADERAWIVQRNNTQADVDTLRQMYKDRIGVLEATARQLAASGAR